MSQGLHIVLCNLALPCISRQILTNSSIFEHFSHTVKLCIPTAFLRWANSEHWAKISTANFAKQVLHVAVCTLNVLLLYFLCVSKKREILINSNSPFQTQWEKVLDMPNCLFMHSLMRRYHCYVFLTSHRETLEQKASQRQRTWSWWRCNFQNPGTASRAPVLKINVFSLHEYTYTF